MKLIEIKPAQIPDIINWLPRTEQEIDTAVKCICDYFQSHTPEEIVLKTDPEVEAAFALVKVKYEPTESDLASRPEDSGETDS
jgi:hypothetical protein